MFKRSRLAITASAILLAAVVACGGDTAQQAAPATATEIAEPAQATTPIAEPELEGFLVTTTTDVTDCGANSWFVVVPKGFT